MKDGPCSGKDCVGDATYKNDVNQTGWAYLDLETRGSFSDVVQVTPPELIPC